MSSKIIFEDTETGEEATLQTDNIQFLTNGRYYSALAFYNHMLKNNFPNLHLDILKENHVLGSPIYCQDVESKYIANYIQHGHCDTVICNIYGSSFIGITASRFSCYIRDASSPTVNLYNELVSDTVRGYKLFLNQVYGTSFINGKSRPKTLYECVAIQQYNLSKVFQTMWIPNYRLMDFTNIVTQTVTINGRLTVKVNPIKTVSHVDNFIGHLLKLHKYSINLNKRAVEYYANNFS